MEKQFYDKLELARQNLIDEVNKIEFNVSLRVAAEDIVILIDQLIEQQK